jgi:hypothetical protein
MIFASPLFLFVFLPVALSTYLLLRGTQLRNLWLLLASVVFHASHHSPVLRTTR